MSVIPVARFLTDFGIKDTAGEIADVLPPAVPALADSIWEERIDEAYARGMEEGRGAAEAEATARLDEQKAASEHSVAAARQTWVEETGPHIAAQITTALASMQDRIAEAVERVLRPFLAQAAREEAVRQLRATLQELIGTNPGLTLEISGPEDLLDALRASLAASAAAVSYVVNETTDVQIKAGASLIETRIAAWLKNCEGQVA
ncbi:MAG: hypothetical protein WDN31_05765 [Hyphomicrobium sp.]